MASTYLQRTESAGNRRTFTISGWVKRSNPNTSSVIFGAGHTSAQNMFQIVFHILHHYIVIVEKKAQLTRV